MKELSMFYNVKYLLCSTTLALALGIYSANDAHALLSAPQADNTPGRVTLAPEAENADAVAQINAPSSNPTVLPNSSAPTQNNPQMPSVNTSNASGLENVGGQNAQQPSIPQMGASANSLPDGSNPMENQVKEKDPFSEIVPLSDEEKALYGDNILNQLSDDLFSQMSDIEKQSALLSLELRREKIRAEIEAIRNQRKKAAEEEEALKAEKERKRLEWEAEQEKKKFEMEQEKMKLEMEAEKLRQENIVKAYKEKMLEKEQNWVKAMSEAYKEMDAINKDREFLLNDFVRKLNNLQSIATQAVGEATNAQSRYNKDVSALKAQISILKARLAAEQAARQQTNPFAQMTENVEQTLMLNDVYAIMEIVGKDDNLVAKLINKNGDTFLVKKGTVLQTGHVINDISETFISATLNGVQDYLFFSAGGILDAEPPSGIDSQKASTTVKKNVGKAQAKAGTPSVGLFSSEVPSLGKGMFVK